MPRAASVDGTRAASRGGRYRKGAARRQEILAAALEVIGRQGVEAASIGAIARAVGLSPTGIMHYFPNRTALLLDVLAERDRQDRLQADGRAGLAALRGAVRRNTSTPALVLLYVSLSAAAADPEHEARVFFAAHHRELIELVAEDVAADQRDGAIRTDLPPELLARLLVAAADGLQLQWLMDPSFDMAEALDLLLLSVRPG